MSNILQVAVPTGQPALVWPAKSDPTVNSLLFINQDINNTVWLGQTSTVTAAGVNSIPILPNGTFSGDASSAWYVVGNVAGTKPLVMVPNGQAYFLGLTAGLGKLVIPQIQSPNFVTGVSGWIIRKDGSAEFNNVVIRGGIVVSGTSLQYSGTPALGNLIASSSSTTTVDAFGNNVYQGTWTYQPSGTATPDFGSGIDNGIVTVGTGNALNGTGGAIPSTFASGGDGFLDIDSGGTATGDVSSGITFHSKNVDGTTPMAIINGAIGLNQLVANPSSAFTSIYADILTNALSASKVGGFKGQLAIQQIDTSDNPNNNAATQALTAQFTIPAGDAHVGTTYEIEVPFNGVFEASGLSFKPALNTTSVVTSLGDGVNAALLGAGVGFTGWVKLIMRVKTVGAGGTVDYFIEGGLGQNAQHTATNSAILSSQSTGMPFDTTSSNTLRVNSVWTAAVAGQAVTGHGSTFTRKGP